MSEAEITFRNDFSGKITLYSGRGGSSSSGGVDSVPHRKANSTEYRRHASK